jgi:hypothetical protein
MKYMSTVTTGKSSYTFQTKKRMAQGAATFPLRLFALLSVGAPPGVLVSESSFLMKKSPLHPHECDPASIPNSTAPKEQGIWP